MIAHLDPHVIARLLALIDGASLRLLIAIAAAGGEMKDQRAAAKAAKISPQECAAAVAAIAAVKIIELRNSGTMQRARIVYPGLLVLHPSSAETVAARKTKSSSPQESDAGRRSLRELREERVAKLQACGGEALVALTDALIATLIERAGGRWAVSAQLRVYEAVLGACAERGPAIAAEAVRATTASRVDPTKAPERYLAAVARRLESGESTGGLAPKRPAPKIPRPKPVMGPDDF